MDTVDTVMDDFHNKASEAFKLIVLADYARIHAPYDKLYSPELINCTEYEIRIALTNDVSKYLKSLIKKEVSNERI